MGPRQFIVFYYILKVFVFIYTINLSPVAAKSNKNHYLSNLSHEKKSEFQEIYILITPPPFINWSHLIVTPELDSEFKNEYRTRFNGHWTNQSFYNPTDLFTANNPDVLSDAEEKREFAEYMLKRLTEWHVDNYVKSDPSMKVIYETKEKLQKIEVKVTQQTKVHLRYSLAGNTFDLLFENPYFKESRIVYKMDPKAFGPTPAQDTQIWLSKNLSKRNTIQLVLQEKEKGASLLMQQDWGFALSTYYGGEIYNETTEETPNLGVARVGLAWTF